MLGHCWLLLGLEQTDTPAWGRPPDAVLFACRYFAVAILSRTPRFARKDDYLLRKRYERALDCSCGKALFARTGTGGYELRRVLLMRPRAMRAKRRLYSAA